MFTDTDLIVVDSTIPPHPQTIWYAGAELRILEGGRTPPPMRTPKARGKMIFFCRRRCAENENQSAKSVFLYIWDQNRRSYS